MSAVDIDLLKLQESRVAHVEDLLAHMWEAALATNGAQSATADAVMRLYQGVDDAQGLSEPQLRQALASLLGTSSETLHRQEGISFFLNALPTTVAEARARVIEVGAALRALREGLPKAQAPRREV